MFSLLTFVLAILALSFLIFIHELGHYFMARRVGMRVEVFSIGIGRALVSWMRDGVKWQIGWLPFGGYVKIAGSETDKNQDPYQVKDGFFGKSPKDRILVALMGPLVNLLFALMVFALLWVGGGREKNFSEFTSIAGWVDPKSELYQKGVRPGDAVVSYNGIAFESAKDHLYAPMTADKDLDVKGLKVNYLSHDTRPFEYHVKPYPNPLFVDKGILTSGILNSASYILYDKLPGGRENPLPEGSPMDGSGLSYGDRVVWVDGRPVFSVPELTDVLNDERTLLTVQRGTKTFLKRAPRIKIQEFKLDPEFKEELIDWQYEGDLKNIKTSHLLVLPYHLTGEGVVIDSLKFIDPDKEKEEIPETPFSSLETPLEKGDKIVAVDGFPVKSAQELLNKLQQKSVYVIVERDPNLIHDVIWKDADSMFDHEFDLKAIEEIASTIGTPQLVKTSGNYFLLKPVTPKMRIDFIQAQNKSFKNEISDEKNQAETIEDPAKRAEALHLIEARQKQKVLGLPMIQDLKVIYNPVPTDLFKSVFFEIWRTLKALFTGTLNPKWLSGPVGIVQVVHDQGMLGLNELLFWMGAISLNLGVLNLLPIPMLDGGTIMLSLFELVTGRKMKPKTMERLILPFAVLLILFFVFVTYNDIHRIVGWR